MGHKRRTPAARLATITGLFGLVAFTVTGCDAGTVLRFGWPDAVTPQGDRMREFWTWSTVAALVVGVIVWSLILWPVIAHRKRGDALPRQFQYNHALEWVYTGIPTIAVVVLFYFTVTTQNFVMAKVDNPDVTIDVVAFQWNWEFDYRSVRSGTGVDNPTSPGDSTVRTVGSSAEIPLLVLPTHKVIQYNLHSKDVIHSFFVPYFNFKRDVFPQPEKNNQDWNFQNTIDSEGSFVGRCAELCGTYHSQMNFEVRALNSDRFDAYLALREKVNPQTGKGYTAAEALAELGRTDSSCGDLCTPHAVTTHPFDTSRGQQAEGAK